ncbi:hypothetical protein J2128_001616 [Methanomicrobium sp. W14]|uniref:hypothetical protein n=1 Tax=Methanomicrobium sp. W14 TaxID=2817839 RepID=UPI001AEA6D85|nr:hypothetical protein [Methanomicrobium sp. W14]MBP2133662.1 hypothetical protein [Methanomicrobium sp. W14]
MESKYFYQIVNLLRFMGFIFLYATIILYLLYNYPLSLETLGTLSNYILAGLTVLIIFQNRHTIKSSQKQTEIMATNLEILMREKYKPIIINITHRIFNMLQDEINFENKALSPDFNKELHQKIKLDIIDLINKNFIKKYYYTVNKTGHTYNDCLVNYLNSISPDFNTLLEKRKSILLQLSKNFIVTKNIIFNSNKDESDKILVNIISNLYNVIYPGFNDSPKNQPFLEIPHIEKNRFLDGETRKVIQDREELKSNIYIMKNLIPIVKVIVKFDLLNKPNLSLNQPTMGHRITQDDIDNTQEIRKLFIENLEKSDENFSLRKKRIDKNVLDLIKINNDILTNIGEIKSKFVIDYSLEGEDF